MDFVVFDRRCSVCCGSPFLFWSCVMLANVEIRLGNLFDGSADVVVLPCNTDGGVAPFVAHSLATYEIPRPGPVELGQITLLPLEHAQAVAKYAAFASSVRDGSITTRQTLVSIGEKLGLACSQIPSLRLVSAPLLGAGAGGCHWEDVVRGLRDGFRSTAPQDATLRISVLHESIYSRLIRPESTVRVNNADTETGRRVFISYAAEGSPTWADELGRLLRKNGFNSRLDQWHLELGVELAQWMSNELAMADRVIIVSDEIYKEKADGHRGGVGWETRIIQGDMLELSPDSTKYVVIVRSNTLAAGTPRYLKGKYLLHWPGNFDDTAKQELLLRSSKRLSPAPEILRIARLE